MAQQATNPKIEELRIKIKSDPKSRLFYQLAEELRKVKGFDEAEQVLRAGLAQNPTYLAAWVSLGRTLRELDKHNDAIDALNKALQLDPGNVVAARLMADAYLDLGDKVEAIKKYKLVRALLPVDEELNALIDRLEDEINPVTILKDEEPVAERTQPGAVPSAAPPPPAAPEEQPAPVAAEGGGASLESPFAREESPFADAAPALEEEHKVDVATGDAEPMSATHEESPFEEPAPSYTAAAVDVEQPLGMRVEPSPMTAEIPAPWTPEEQPPAAPDVAADVFEPAAETPAAASAPAEDVANTMTMAELYIQQGFPERAQSIYESILDRDPNNDEVRAKLDALENASRPQPSPTAPQAAPARNPKVNRLEEWLARVKRGEERRV